MRQYQIFLTLYYAGIYDRSADFFGEVYGIYRAILKL